MGMLLTIRLTNLMLAAYDRYRNNSNNNNNDNNNNNNYISVDMENLPRCLKLAGT